MPYRLTDASALGLDLARTPGGVGAARVLLRLLLAGPQDVRTPVRARADLVVSRERARELLGHDGPTVVDLTAVEGAGRRPAGAAGPAADHGSDAGHGLDADLAADPEDAAASAAALARRLQRLARRLGAVSFGTVGDLLALGRGLAEELVVASAVPADDLPDVDTDALLAELVRERDDVPASVLASALAHRLDPLAPGHPALPPLLPSGRALLAAGPSPVVLGTAALVGRVAAAREEVLLLPGRPAPQVWAEHMHSVAWAVETTGRTRLAAAAQLDLLRSLDAAGVTPAALLGGVWNACSAAVAAQVVLDVLPNETHDVLCADLLEVLPG
ncbi:hypothetical protein ACFQL5_16635 [Aquipuribacter hungaricus]|uniref:hypothetical protein n=1 Tax=Aquipuribacter hungaricus TaxID=545624 RepID=UPI0036078548